MTKVIIIGAGIGGVASAAILASKGYKVEVYEKNAYSGGRCSLIETKTQSGTYRFDQGASMYLMNDVFENLYSSLGLDVNKELKLIKCNPNYNIFFGDDSKVTLGTDLSLMKEELEKIEPGSFKKYCEFISQNKYKYDVSLDLVMGTNSNNVCEFIGATIKHPEALFKMNIIEKHYSYISKFFKTDKLRQAFSFQNMYMGISPYDATAAYSILQYIECAMGIWYPEGGMWQIINTLIKDSEKNGVIYHYNKSVIDIDIDNGVAKGVILETGERIEADIILCNADLSYAYKSLVHDTEYVKKLDTMEYTSSTISFYWGIKKKVNGLQGHNIFLAEDYKESFVQIFKDLEIPDVPSFYLHVPSKIDPTCAPDGCEVITVLVPIGHLKNDNDTIDYTDLIIKTKKAILSKLKASGIEDFEKDIEFEDVNTPNTWKSKFNLYKGAALGLNHQLTQMFFLRPHNKSKYKNLYFVGASTHPGTGVPVVVSSARLVCEVIDNDYGA